MAACFVTPSRKGVLSSMNAAHFHIVINHLPVLGSIIAFLILLAGLLIKSRALRMTGGFMFILCALATVPTYLSGEPAEEIVEKAGVISENIIETHESWAQIALAAMGPLGLFSLGTFAWIGKDRMMPSWFAGFLLLVSLAPIGLMGYTANLGGRIRHTEIYGVAPANATAEQPGAETAVEKDDDDK